MIFRNRIKQIIFDADDTLWENNIYYVRASNDFYDLLGKAGFSRREVEKEFDELEIKVVEELGYGSKNFVIILEELFNRYNKRNGKNLDQGKFKDIVSRFSDHPTTIPDLFPGVI